MDTKDLAQGQGQGHVPGPKAKAKDFAVKAKVKDLACKAKNFLIVQKNVVNLNKLDAMQWRCQNFLSFLFTLL